MVHQCGSEEGRHGMFGIHVARRRSRRGPAGFHPGTKRIRRANHRLRERLRMVAAGRRVLRHDSGPRGSWCGVSSTPRTTRRADDPVETPGAPGRSVYGPAVDTGGLPANGVRTIYAYPSIPALITGESAAGKRRPCPGRDRASTERAGSRVSSVLSLTHPSPCSPARCSPAPRSTSAWSHPARLNCGTSRRNGMGSSYKRAAVMQASLAIASFLGGVAAWSQRRSL